MVNANHTTVTMYYTPLQW